MPPAFVFALSCHYLPNGRGSRKVQINQSTAFDFWYFLPIRVQVRSGPSHPGKPDDAPGANQMNPFHELHLPGAKVDIRQSCVGIFSRVEPASKRVTFVAFDFMHGRWPKVALEPRQRIDEVMKHKKNTSTEYADGYFIHLVYLSSATRWFRNALNSCNEQLIAYELQLQTELNCEQATPEAVLTDINRALHSIAAHLHRYLSELKSSQGIVVDLSTYYESIYTSETADSDLGSFEQASRGLSQVSSQIEALRDFAEELEKKIKNILALLFSRIQISSDRLLVANGQAMQAILSAMQEDATLGRKMAKASHALAEEMRRDSVAMRTIAVVTMFFLPGATFAVSSFGSISPSGSTGASLTVYFTGPFVHAILQQ
ncbi:hypothetical protein DTO271G3_5798 [Paecilomyces variotii]|nr:hypothetical protein DTO271G3_5798 [Paecilomyces variotii]